MKRKNFAMRIAALLFILTMISTCAFATTFAKYVTSGTSSDTARVAKWGVTITQDASALFAEKYEIHDTETDFAGALTVEAEEDVVAPGTSGTFTSLEVSGEPEVAVEVSYTATLTLEGWLVAGVDYCPIVFEINGEEVTGATMAELKANVEAAIAALSATYGPNTVLNDYLEVSWSWAFEGNDDVKDTVLGDAGTATITLAVTCTVTQID